MHTLICGITESGKTTLAKQIARRFRDKGIGVIVLDPMHDQWDADYQTPDPNEFMDVARKSQSCALFIDESGESIGRYNDQMFWLATRARHYGHKSFFITQRPMQLARTVRDQCTAIYCFCVGKDDAKVLSNEYNCEALLNANSFPQFHGLYKTRFGPPRKIQVNPLTQGAP